MSALLWKDIRMNASVLVLTGALFALPYLAGFGWLVNESMARGTGPMDVRWSYDAVMRTGFLSLILSHIGMTILVGNALACERETGSEGFLAALPPTRARVLLSKTAVTAGTIILLWALSVFVLLVLAPTLPDAPAFIVPGVHDDPAVELSWVASVAALIFGVAWWLSSFVQKSSTAWVLALLSPLALVGLALLTRSVFSIGDLALDRMFLWSCVLLGLAGGSAGTVLFLRKSEF